MLKKILLSLFMLEFMVACGDDVRPYTWGIMVEEVSIAYCEAIETCGYWEETETEKCIKHSVHHLCELDGTCSVKMKKQSEAAREAVDACVSELYMVPLNTEPGEVNCFGIAFFGQLPKECTKVWEFQPQVEE